MLQYCDSASSERSSTMETIRDEMTGLLELGDCPVSASEATCHACSDAGADRHVVKRTATPDPKAMPPRSFNICVNPNYPLLSTTQPPLSFVRPADVMPPTAMEAEFGISCNKNNHPVVTPKSLSAPLVVTKGTYRPPRRVFIWTLLQPPVPQTCIATTGTMGPPLRPVKK